MAPKTLVDACCGTLAAELLRGHVSDNFPAAVPEPELLLRIWKLYSSWAASVPPSHAALMRHLLVLQAFAEEWHVPQLRLSLPQPCRSRALGQLRLLGPGLTHLELTVGPWLTDLSWLVGPPPGQQPHASRPPQPVPCGQQPPAQQEQQEEAGQQQALRLTCLALRGLGSGLRAPCLGPLAHLAGTLVLLDLTGAEGLDDGAAGLLAGMRAMQARARGGPGRVLNLSHTAVGDLTLQALTYGARAAGWARRHRLPPPAEAAYWPELPLHRLHLAGTRVSGAGVALLGDLARLTFLDLRGTGVPRSALRPLETRFGLSVVQGAVLAGSNALAAALINTPDVLACGCPPEQLAAMAMALFLHFKKPVMIVEGKMQYLYDERGRRYLDAFAGIVTVSVGHCHPEVTEAVARQSALLQHTTTIYLNPQVAEYAKELADRMPGNLKVVYFVNSGSEANDMALMLARLYTGNWDVVCLRNAYHGMSIGTMGTCGQHTWKQPMPQGFGYHHALNPDPYRGAFGDDGPRYAADVADLISAATPGRVAGFVAETIQGVGGAVSLASGYLPAVYKMIREAGGVCIADEVQTGFGRTGSHYWGFERQGVLPDIVTMAKGIGNGLPLAAVVTTPEIAASMAGRLHFNTYGGNPVCSAGGRAVLRVVDRERLQQHCADVGAHLLSRLGGLAQRHDIIGDVRGAGLMLGVELVKDRRTKEPAKAETAAVMETMKDLGVLMGKGGLHGNVFRIKPPMCFSRADADFLVDVMDVALSKL
ncbi:hypothetical protein GPECTOR_1g689 [Gonium pectorale]|uniref:alanine--glyoxylate transaminase n=1 Tax=Gonium pectorale TaxID=33097 RepID=A0A150H3X6_GONPE|nr:hypothetical protein GPECTOR_1g689 [Gonium pectorale]|eukprot:KXZ56764.1 hypothetical protein GPECTOR_1g689 [Gonium pectorale]